ncbi:GNAT family N-acetyltransferase [Rheinheimera pleomorphica]|uniref:GNAT family N-acetyltransferase n=1 Tax=Rheinheimera pleomorphica TaxID=2703963 RepID=UPI001421CFFE|nr:GNAT family N-acetyltransferase [Rheinheimera pleomorphica]
MMMLIPTDFIDISADFQLSVFQLSDVDTFVQLFTTADIMKHIAHPLHIDDAVNDAVTASQVSNRVRTRQLYLRIASADGLPAGLLSVIANKECSSFEIGIMLLPLFQSTGLSAAVVKSVCVKLLTRYSGCRICCEINGDNAAARRRALKLGFIATEIKNRYVLDQYILLSSE